MREVIVPTKFSDAAVIIMLQVTMAALSAASNTVLAMTGASVQSSSVPGAGLLRPPGSQPLQAPYRQNNWLQMQAAAHAHMPAQPADPPRPATAPQQPLNSSWVEVQPDLSSKSLSPLQPAGNPFR